MTISFIRGSALTLPLADRTVHLAVTSPPYFALRSYQDGGEHFDGQLGSEPTPHHFLANLWVVMDEVWRVLRDDGSVWLNLGDKFSGSGGGNQSGLLAHRNPAISAVHDSKVNAYDGPRRYNQNTGGLRPKSRMLLPHRFAEGLIDPDYRRWVEARAWLTLTADAPQWICRMDAVWSKPNGMPESATDRVRVSHEYWFHLVKSERYYAAVDEIREEYSPEASDRRTKYGNNPGRDSLAGLRSTGAAQHGSNGVTAMGVGGAGENPLGKLPGSVWEVPTEPLRIPDDLPQHFAAFPSEFPRRLILGWSPSGVCVACGEGRRPVCEKTTLGFDNSYDQGRRGTANKGRWAAMKAASPDRITGTACACPTADAPTAPARVLDPFSGTGTTAVVADALGRHGIGVDLSWDYHRLARWRDQDGGLRAKALGVERPERQIDGQLSLLGEADRMTVYNERSGYSQRAVSGDLDAGGGIPPSPPPRLVPEPTASPTADGAV